MRKLFINQFASLFLGIGRAVSVMLAEKGSSVVAADINESNAVETQKMCQQINSSAQHVSSKVDVAETQSVETLFETIQKTYAKPATILVNCAGILRDNFMLDMSEEDFDKVISVNLKGTFLMTKVSIFEGGKAMPTVLFYFLVDGLCPNGGG